MVAAGVDENVLAAVVFSDAAVLSVTVTEDHRRRRAPAPVRVGAADVTANDHAMALLAGSAWVDACRTGSRMCSAKNLTAGAATPSPVMASASLVLAGSTKSSGRPINRAASRGDRSRERTK